MARLSSKRLTKYFLATSLSAFSGYHAYITYDSNSSSLVRFGRAAIAASLIITDYKWNLRNIDSNHPSYEKILSEVHLRSANRIKNVCCANGGCFIKVGQHIGGLDYLLPYEYVSTMKVLHNQAPQSDVKELFATIEEDLRCKVSDVFKEIDDKPIGTASLAQVHKAKLHDGTQVAVKIQHPNVKGNSYSDIETISFFVNMMALIFPKFELVWLGEETRKNLPIELDFINEGQNAEKLAWMLKKYKFVKVPKIYWKHSSSRVLTMDYCEGVKIDDVNSHKKNGINVNQISQRLGMIFSEMIFKHGFVHCDPHPGNILINHRKNGEFDLVIIDHGLYQNLTKTFRYNYARLWMSILKKNPNDIEEKVKVFLNEKGVYYGLLACIVTGRSWDAITSGIDRVKYSNSEGAEIKSEASKWLREISTVLNKVPREMLLLFKTNDLIRGTETALNTRNSSSAFIHLSKCCVKLISSYERDLNLAKIQQVHDHTPKADYYKLKLYFYSFLIEKFELIKILLGKFYLAFLDFQNKSMYS